MIFFGVTFLFKGFQRSSKSALVAKFTFFNLAVKIFVVNLLNS